MADHSPFLALFGRSGLIWAKLLRSLPFSSDPCRSLRLWAGRARSLPPKSDWFSDHCDIVVDHSLLAKYVADHSHLNQMGPDHSTQITPRKNAVYQAAQITPFRCRSLPFRWVCCRSLPFRWVCCRSLPLLTDRCRSLPFRWMSCRSLPFGWMSC